MHEQLAAEGASSDHLTVSSHSGAAGSLWITLDGELDFATAPQVADLPRRAGDARLVVVDVRQLEFIDVCGARGLAHAVSGVHRRAVLVSAGGCVGRLIELTDLLDGLELVELADPAGPWRPARTGR